MGTLRILWFAALAVVVLCVLVSIIVWYFAERDMFEKYKAESQRIGPWEREK